GLRAGMWLYIGPIRREKFFSTFYGEGFGLVNEFAPAVVAFAWVALGIFVCKNRALRLQHARTRVVLRGDQFQMCLLAAPLSFYGSGQLVVESFYDHLIVEHSCLRDGLCLGIDVFVCILA